MLMLANRGGVVDGKDGGELVGGRRSKSRGNGEKNDNGR